MTDGELILLVWNDLVGLSRTRGVPVGQYERRRRHGLGWALAGQSLTPFEDIAPNPWGPMDEVRQVPDDETRRRIVLKQEWPALHFVLCNSLHTDGTPWECCTRSFLARALADLKTETGIELAIAYENEFLLCGGAMPWAAPFSVDSIRQAAPFADLCTQALINAGVDLETFEPEYGVGQYEVSCGPAAGLAGADRVVVTRETVREAARQCGLTASFSPKPSPDAVGNGCHLHLSLWDEEGNPATADPAGPGGLSFVAARFVAGIRHHLKALTAITAPSPVSYLRRGRTTGAAVTTSSASRIARPRSESARRPVRTQVRSISRSGQPMQPRVPILPSAQSSGRVSRASVPACLHPISSIAIPPG